MRTKGPLSLTFVAILALSLAVLAGCSHKAERTDAQVASDVQNKIYSDQGIQSRQISVQAANGVVTLNGAVNSEVERNAAANDAGAIDGVKTVFNNLQVQQAQAAPPPPPAPVEQPQPAPKAAREKKRPQEAGNRHHRNKNASEDDNYASADM